MKLFLKSLIIALIIAGSINAQSINIPLRITDGVAADTIYLGVDTSATDGIDGMFGESELPPSPPLTVFDVRFTGNLIPPVPIGEGSKRDYRNGTRKTYGKRYHKIKYQTGTGSILKLSWTNIIPQVKIRLQDPVSGNLIDTTFTGTGTYTVPALYLSLGYLNLTVDYDPTVILNLKVIPEGFYNNITDRLSMKDTVKVYVRDNFAPFAVRDSARSLIDSVSFTGSFIFKNLQTGTYYIQTQHRNLIETWSKPGGENFIAGASQTFDFTSSVSQAFGSNLKLKGTRYCEYSGDIIRDGVINLIDVVAAYNSVTLFLTGYAPADVTGDKVVNLTDLVTVFNNSAMFVAVKKP